MGEVVNLNQERKRRQRAEKQNLAAVNRKKHGRKKGERTRDTAAVEQENRDLDGKLIEDQD